MGWLEQKYTGLVSPRLKLFKRKNTVANFRCPFCGDSHKNRFKTRGYLYYQGSRYKYFCHNCNISLKFSDFLEKLDSDLSKQYRFEKFKDANNIQPEVEERPFEQPSFITETPLKHLTKVSALSPSHPAKKWIQARKIPSNAHYRLFFCADFVSWINSIIPDKLAVQEQDDPRIVIPFLTKDHQLFGVAGRTIGDAKKRYITIMFDKDAGRMFGLDTVDWTKHVYLLEGQFDSLFLPNGLAIGGSDFSDQDIPVEKDFVTVVYDNEKRNKEILSKIKSAIDRGYKVCIWPEDIEEKDVNDMILAGRSIDQVKEIIDNNTFQGPAALIAFNNWKRI